MQVRSTERREAAEATVEFLLRAFFTYAVMHAGCLTRGGRMPQLAADGERWVDETIEAMVWVLHCRVHGPPERDEGYHEPVNEDA